MGMLRVSAFVLAKFKLGDFTGTFTLAEEYASVSLFISSAGMLVLSKSAPGSILIASTIDSMGVRKGW